MWDEIELMRENLRYLGCYLMVLKGKREVEELWLDRKDESDDTWKTRIEKR